MKANWTWDYNLFPWHCLSKLFIYKPNREVLFYSTFKIEITDPDIQLNPWLFEI